jgi:hypothetical protein
VWPEVTIDDYTERSAAQQAWWQSQDGHQPGDPDKLAKALVALVREVPPPRRFIAGADVLALGERKIAESCAPRWTPIENCHHRLSLTVEATGSFTTRCFGFL